jgi:hypothetical protein
VIRNGSSSYHHPVDLHFKGEKFGYEGNGRKVWQLGYQVKAKVAFLERERERVFKSNLIYFCYILLAAFYARLYDRLLYILC